MTCYDSNCLVAAADIEHEFRPRTVMDMSARLAAGEPIVLVTHCLVEAFSNLSGGKGGKVRRSPAIVIQALEELVAKLRPRLADRDANAFEAMKLVHAAGRSGGAIFDASIALAARQAGATTLVTWNLQDFQYAIDGLRVEEPGRFVAPVPS